MAKSLRASRVKTNKQKLRKNVFAPVDDARIDRLSAKLAEIVAQKKPSEIAAANVMEVDDGSCKHPHHCHHHLCPTESSLMLTSKLDANKDTKQTEEGRSSSHAVAALPSPTSSSIKPLFPIPSYFLERDAEPSGSEEEEEFYMALGLLSPWKLSSGEMELDSEEDDLEDDFPV